MGVRGLLLGRCVFVAVWASTLGGCALFTQQLDDPNKFLAIDLNTPDFVKSLRCEVITYIVENRLREQLYDRAMAEMTDPVTHDVRPQYAAVFDANVGYLRENYPFISLDAEQFAALSVDLKNINTAGVSVQNDWKFVFPIRSADYHVGPSINEIDTFEYLPPLAIVQNADLGPVKQRAQGQPVHPAAKWSTLYYLQSTTDSGFYCYSSLYNSPARTLEDATRDIEGLVLDTGPYANNKNYRRIHVGTDTLAAWLVKMSQQLFKNQNTAFATAENVLPGQLAYQFTLDLKPAIDLKYTYVAAAINPFVPDISGGVEHSSQFSIFLNTVYSAAALGAKGGNSCNKTIPNANCAKKS